jgi:DNA repair exonuclease SbcCD ATPase subunit
VEAAHDNRRQLGQLMVEEGILTSEQLTSALAEQDRTGQPLGEILVELGFASPGAVANSLAEQHGGLLKTEYGVSAGLRTVSDAGLANAPVRPVLPVSESRNAAEESEVQGEAAGLRVIPIYPPPADGPSLVPAPVAALPDPPAQIPNAEEARIADLSARLDDTTGKLRVSQQARDAFSKRVTELEAQLASATPGDAAPQPDPAQAARVEQLEAHIQQLDAHIKAAAVDRESIVQHYTELQAQLAAAQAAAPESDPAEAARIQELEAQLQAATVERQGLAENLAELQARLSETSQARDAERNEAAAGVAARVSVLEEQLRDAVQERTLLEQRTSELQDSLLASEQARAGDQTAVAEAVGRIAELEAQLAQAEARAAEPAEGAVELEAQLQSVVAERDALLAGVAEHETVVTTLRDQLAGRDRQLAESAAVEPDTEQMAELEAQVTSLREQLAARPVEREASTVDLRALVENVEHEAMAALREDLADRDRRLAENVNELARLNRELAESAEREAALASLRSELAERDRQLAERATLVENVEHDAMTALRQDLGEREQLIARTSEELAERDRRLAEIAEEIARMNGAHESLTTRLREELAERERQLAEKAEELGRLHDLGEVAASVEDEHMHVLFIPTSSGYSLLERSGPAPAVGASVDVDGDSENAGHFVVCKHGRPVPGGPRCAYVERV